MASERFWTLCRTWLFAGYGTGTVVETKKKSDAYTFWLLREVSSALHRFALPHQCPRQIFLLCDFLERIFNILLLRSHIFWEDS